MITLSWYLWDEWFTSGGAVAPRVIIFNNDLGNVPTEGIFACDYSSWYLFNCDAWYFKTQR